MRYLIEDQSAIPNISLLRKGPLSRKYHYPSRGKVQERALFCFSFQERKKWLGAGIEKRI
jgi:hypothetical protein